MRAFADYNPIAVFFGFAGILAAAMFVMEPVLLLLALLGGMLYACSLEGTKWLRSLLFYGGLFVVITLLNPVFNHRGATVLLVVNDDPVTLEAVRYGACFAVMLIDVLIWFRSFTLVMTTDKLLYLFGSVSPKLALILSMVLRYVLLYKEQAGKTADAQTVLGLYGEDSIPERIRGSLRVFSVMVTWALENGVVTADSMTARGYGVGRRSRFSIFRFGAADGILTFLCILLSAVVLTAIGLKAVRFEFYPFGAWAPASPLRFCAYAAYGLLTLIPAILQLLEVMKWHCLKSEI